MMSAIIFSGPAMFDYITQHEPDIRLGFFVGSLLLFGLWETIAPRRVRINNRLWHWANNLGLTFLNTAILRVVFPLLAVGMATMAIQNGWGLLNMVDLPLWLAVIIAIIVQDLVIYGQHVMVHHVPLLWRLHKVHHADRDYDVTTGARFHPLEIILSMVIKLATVFLLGPPVVAVIIFEIILSTAAMFNHANAGLPKPVDRLIRLFLVTPDMHRVHHSTLPNEHHRNFGFNLPWWDYLFGTYRAEPSEGQTGMTIGLEQYQSEQKQHLLWMLLLPFKRK